MKKIYLCALALSVGSLSFAQRATVKTFSDETLRTITPEDKPLKSFTANDKAPGDVIWSEDFTGGIPAGWTTVDNTGNGFDWVINNAAINNTASGTGGGFTNTGAIASTSGGNHMLLFGDNYNANGGSTEMDAYFQTDAITLSGEPSVSIRYQQKFRLCCAAAADLSVEVSTDPTFATFSVYDARGATAINIQSADPEVKSINISDNFGSFTGDIYLRFHWVSGASHYYWMVDDIEVIETVSNNIVTSRPYYGLLGVPYTRIPANHLQQVDFSIDVTNLGAVDQTNTTLEVLVNGASVASSTGSTLLALGAGVTVPGTVDTIALNGAYTIPSTVGIPYTIGLTISTDSLSVTDTTEFPPFQVSNDMYALDDFGAPGNGGGLSGNGTAEFEAGNFFDAIVNDTLTSIDVTIGPAAIVGTVLDAVLYELDASGTFVEISRSNFYTTTAADNGNEVSFPIANGFVNAGSNYFMAIHTFSEFEYGISGLSPVNGTPGGTQSLIFYPNMTAPNTGENFFTSRTPMIRGIFSNIVSVEELNKELSFSVYPNPSRGDFNIDLDAKKSGTVNLSVRNIVGQTVLTKSISVSGQTRENLSLSSYDKGIYFLTIDNNEEKTTVKLIVE